VSYEPVTEEQASKDDWLLHCSGYFFGKVRAQDPPSMPW
jgi:hypothetical protein